MKICKKCKLEKEDSEFYVYNNSCKQCKRDYQKFREKTLRENSPEWIKKERLRGVMKYYRLGYRDKNKPSYEKKKETMDRYLKKYPERYEAAKAIALMDRKEGYHLHHWSYNEEHFKDVIELEVKTHHRIHRYMKYDPVQKKYRSVDGEILDSKEKHQIYVDSLLSMPF